MFTHVLVYGGGTFSIQFNEASFETEVFDRTLRRFDGTRPWALRLQPLHGRDYDEMQASHEQATEFLQAAGTADRMTIDVRQPGGEGWGAASVWSVVGRPSTNSLPISDTIKTPHASVYEVAANEIFEAAEANVLFTTYYRTGSLPKGYVLRPLSGYTNSGDIIVPPADGRRVNRR